MIRISEAVGRLVKCPDNRCGHPVVVQHAKQRVSAQGRSSHIQTAPLWYRLDCPKSGAKLYPAQAGVELAKDEGGA